MSFSATNERLTKSLSNQGMRDDQRQGGRAFKDETNENFSPSTGLNGFTDYTNRSHISLHLLRDIFNQVFFSVRKKFS